MIILLYLCMIASRFWSISPHTRQYRNFICVENIFIHLFRAGFVSDISLQVQNQVIHRYSSHTHKCSPLMTFQSNGNVEDEKRSKIGQQHDAQESVRSVSWVAEEYCTTSAPLFLIVTLFLTVGACNRVGCVIKCSW